MARTDKPVTVLVTREAFDLVQKVTALTGEDPETYLSGLILHRGKWDLETIQRGLKVGRTAATADLARLERAVQEIRRGQKSESGTSRP